MLKQHKQLIKHKGPSLVQSDLDNTHIPIVFNEHNIMDLFMEQDGLDMQDIAEHLCMPNLADSVINN